MTDFTSTRRALLTLRGHADSKVAGIANTMIAQIDTMAKEPVDDPMRAQFVKNAKRLQDALAGRTHDAVLDPEQIARALGLGNHPRTDQ